MLRFIGLYTDVPIFVMGHEMGIPSCSTYVKELITEFGARVMAILTVSDHIRTNNQTIAVEYQTTFNGMIKNSLESIVREYTKIKE